MSSFQDIGLRDLRLWKMQNGLPNSTQGNAPKKLWLLEWVVRRQLSLPVWRQLPWPVLV